MNTTEKCIKKAVDAAVKANLGGHTISGCHVTVSIEATEATQSLAEALLAQAEANDATSRAIQTLAATLKPIDICGIKVGGK